jgi:hypothetical protein
MAVPRWLRGIITFCASVALAQSDFDSLWDLSLRKLETHKYHGRAVRFQVGYGSAPHASTRLPEANQVHRVFVPAANSLSKQQKIVRKTIIVVGESDTCAEEGADILLNDRCLRFAASQARPQESGLRFSSCMLALPRTVHH